VFAQRSDRDGTDWTLHAAELAFSASCRTSEMFYV
jgi:hypothetical protein